MGGKASAKKPPKRTAHPPQTAAPTDFSPDVPASESSISITATALSDDAFSDNGEKTDRPLHEQMTWTRERASFLLKTLQHLAKKGKRAGGSLKPEAWKKAQASFIRRFKMAVAIQPLKSRYYVEKRRWEAIQKMKGLSGWGWSEQSFKPLVDDVVFDAFVAAQPKGSRPMYKDLRALGCPDYPVLKSIFEKTAASGRFAKSSSAKRASSARSQTANEAEADASGLSEAPTDDTLSLNEEGNSNDNDSSEDETADEIPFALNTDPTTPSAASTSPSPAPALATGVSQKQRAASPDESIGVGMRSKRSHAKGQGSASQATIAWQGSLDKLGQSIADLAANPIPAPPPLPPMPPSAAVMRMNNIMQAGSLLNSLVQSDDVDPLNEFLRMEDIFVASEIFASNPVNADLFLSFQDDRVRVGFIKHLVKQKH